MFSSLIVAALQLAPPAYAEALPAPPDLERPGQGRRRAGIALTAVGGALAVGGGAMALTGAVSMSPCDESRPDCNTGNAFLLVGGGAIAGLGAPFLAVGIPLWVTGNRRMNEAPQAVLWHAPDGATHAAIVARF